MSRTTIWIMTLAAGVVVANNYYNQPLLVDFARSFHATAGEAGSVAILTQLGYAMGLMFLLPLGDMIERRQLVSVLLALASLSLVGVALASSLAWLATASFALGFTSIVPQVLPSFAAQLAEPRDRGRIVGRIMSGLLCGILLSRFVAGVVGLYLGWAAVYWGAAAAMIVLAFALRLSLPYAAPPFKGHYFALLRSLGTLFKEEPVLRQTMAIAALQFAAFSGFWTTIAFELYSLPPHYGSGVAGSFGLAGVAGVLAAPLTGRFADRRSARFAVFVASLIFLAAFAVFALAHGSLIVLVVGVILLDLGLQSAHVSNMTRNYALKLEAVSRLNTVYMSTRFLGGAGGAALSNVAWTHWGWAGVSGAGLVLSGAAIAVQFIMPVTD